MSDKGHVESGSEIIKNVTESLVNMTKVLDYFRKSFGINSISSSSIKDLLQKSYKKLISSI